MTTVRVDCGAWKGSLRRIWTGLGYDELNWTYTRTGKRHLKTIAVPALQKILGHASLAMTMRYAHLSPEHLRGEMAKTERSAGMEPDAGTRAGQSGQTAPEVVEFTDERRGSSVAEQLIRNEPVAPPTDTQNDVSPGNQTQQP